MVARRTPSQPASGRRVSRSGSSSSSSSSSSSRRTVRRVPSWDRAGGHLGSGRRGHIEGIAGENGMNMVNGVNGVHGLNDVIGFNGINEDHGNTGVNGNNGGGDNGGDVTTTAAMVVDKGAEPSTSATADNSGAPTGMAATVATTTIADPLFQPPESTHAHVLPAAALPGVTVATTVANHDECAEATTIASAAAASADTPMKDSSADPTNTGAAGATVAGTRTVAIANGGGSGRRESTTFPSFGFMTPTMPGTRTWLARLRVALSRGWTVPRLHRSLSARMASDAASAASMTPPAPPPSPMAISMRRMSVDGSSAPTPPSTPSTSGGASYMSALLDGGMSKVDGRRFPAMQPRSLAEITSRGYPMVPINIGRKEDDIATVIWAPTATAFRAAETSAAADHTNSNRTNSARAAAMARAASRRISTGTVEGDPATRSVCGSHMVGTFAGLSLNPSWEPFVTPSPPAAGAAAAAPPEPSTSTAAQAAVQNTDTQAEDLPSGMVTPPQPAIRENVRPGTPHPAPWRGRYVEPPMPLRPGLQQYVPVQAPPPLVGRGGKVQRIRGGVTRATIHNTGHTATETMQIRLQALAHGQEQARLQTQAQDQARKYKFRVTICRPRRVGEEADRADGAAADDTMEEVRGSISILSTSSQGAEHGPADADRIIVASAEDTAEDRSRRPRAWSTGVETSPGMGPATVTAAVQATEGGSLELWPVDASPMEAMEAAAQVNGGNGGSGGNDAVDVGSDADWVVDGLPMSPTTVSPPSSIPDVEDEDEMRTGDQH